MNRYLSLLSLVLLCFMGCSQITEEMPAGPIARFGTTPTIDGVFEDGEWDDATIVSVDSVEQFRIKHDSTNLYIGTPASGGNIWFNTDKGLRVLHWSAQLGSAEYLKSDASTQSLDKPYAYELWALNEESPAAIRDSLTAYLARNGWASNIAPMGSLKASEMVVSFDWLGVSTESGRYVEIPGVRVDGGLMLARNDPRAKEIMAMPREETEIEYPPVFWPTESVPNDSISRGHCPETITVDTTAFGKIWIDLEG